MDKDLIDAQRDFNNSLEELKLALENVNDTYSSIVLPAMNDLVRALNSITRN